jgi:hypothetical protein
LIDNEAQSVPEITGIYGGLIKGHSFLLGCRYAGSMLINLSERQIIKVWYHQMLDRTELATKEGNPIKTIYPGRMNYDRGPDFRDAVIATGGGLIHGDIEVHVKSSGWLSHGHHQDPAYNGVALHVVMWPDTETTNLQNGKRVPILAINECLSRPLSQPSPLTYCPATLALPCHRAKGRLTIDIVAELLDNAGLERFLVKANHFQVELAQMETGQCL